MLSLLQKYEDWLMLGGGLLLALALRLLLRGYVSGDAVTGFLPWFDYIRSQGGLPALGHAFSGYPPLYLYMLVASYYANLLLHLSDLAAIKSIPIIFDFFAAFWAFKIVRLRTSGRAAAVGAALVFLFTPTVFMNGAMWGQIDGIFTSFLLMSLYYLLQKRDFMAMLGFGLAFSIKFQAVFLAPFLLLLLLLGRISFRSLFIVPGVYFASILPNWILGRSLGELLMIYPNQVGSFDALSLNAPTFYALIDNSVNYLFNTAGVIVAGVLVLLSVYAVYKLKPRLDAALLVELAAACLLMLPYLLPKMHDRYFFPAEVFFVLAAFFRPRLAWVAAALQIAALVTYNYYFFGSSFLPLATDALFMLGILIYVLYDVGKQVWESREKMGALPAAE